MSEEEERELQESGTEIIRELFAGWFEVRVGFNDFYDCPFCQAYVNKECLMKEGPEPIYVHFPCAMELHEALKIVEEEDE